MIARCIKQSKNNPTLQIGMEYPVYSLSLYNDGEGAVTIDIFPSENFEEPELWEYPINCFQMVRSNIPDFYKTEMGIHAESFRLTVGFPVVIDPNYDLAQMIIEDSPKAIEIGKNIKQKLIEYYKNYKKGIIFENPFEFTKQEK